MCYTCIQLVYDAILQIIRCVAFYLIKKKNINKLQESIQNEHYMLRSKLTVLVSVVDVFIIWPTKLHPARWSRHIFVREKLRKRRGSGKRRWDFPPFSFVLHRGSVAFAFRRLVKASVDHRAGGAGPRTNTMLAVFWSHSRSLRLLRVTPAVCDYWLPAANVLLFSLELCDIPLPVTMHVIKRGKTLSILAVHLASVLTC